MDDKKTAIHFGSSCHIGDEVLRLQYMQQHSDRPAAAAVTGVAVTQYNDQRCSYCTGFNSPRPNEPAGTGDGGTPVGPADAMGPLNIMAAIIPFELATWPAADTDNHINSLNSSWKSSSESSIEIRFDDNDDEEMCGAEE